MNERIRELAKQAHDFAFEQTNRGLMTDAHRVVFEKKFAELIVQECCESFQGYTFEEIAVKTLKATFRS
jgi:hypothetical protein